MFGHKHKKNMMQLSPQDSKAGMDSDTKRHFDKVKRKMFAFIGQQQRFESDGMHMPPSPTPMAFADQKKALIARPVPRTPLVGHKHIGHQRSPMPPHQHIRHQRSPMPPHKQLPHLALATPQLQRRPHNGRLAPDVVFFWIFCVEKIDFYMICKDRFFKILNGEFLFTKVYRCFLVRGTLLGCKIEAWIVYSLLEKRWSPSQFRIINDGDER